MKLFFLGLFILFGNSFFSQKLIEGNFNFKNYSIDQGLPSSETYDVEQDNEGNIWIATDRGVVKYNSRTFKTFTKKDGLIDDVVLQIYKDPFGRLWFLTIENQLCYYEKGKIKKYRYNYLIKKNFPFYNHPDKDLIITKNNDLYFSSRYIGALKITNRGISKKMKIPDNHLYIFNIQNKCFWASKVIPGSTHIFTEFIQNKFKSNLEKEKHASFKILTSENKEKTFFLINNRVKEFNKKTNHIRTILNFPSTSIVLMKFIDEKLFIGGLKEGIQIYDKKFKFITHQLKNNTVTNVLKDTKNGYWLTTLENGVFFLPDLNIKNYNTSNGLKYSTISSVIGTQNSLYIGYFGDNYQLLKNNRLIHTHHNKGNGYTTFGKVGNDIIISSVNGTFQKNKLIKSFWQKDFFIGDNYCLSIKDQILKYHPNFHTDTLFQMKYEYQKIKVYEAVMQDGEGDIWAGTNKGLYILKNKNLIPIYQKTFPNRITDLNYNKIWGKLIATRNRGIFQLKKGKFIKINKLLSDDITTTFIYKNELWIGTNKGVNRVILNNKNRRKIICYTKNNGLISNEINSLYVNKNNAWIGTKKGLVEINLSFNKEISKDAEIKLEDITLRNNKKIINFNHISIPYSEDLVKIKFGIINYFTKGKYKYRFNNNSNWTYIYNPEILLINPKPGNYNLNISFLNENNEWSKPKKICNFQIESPFWETIYFKIIIILSLVLIVYLYISFKKNQFETKQKLIILEQKALFAQMNPHFIFNTLNSIQSFLIYNENDKAEYFLSKFSKLLRETLHVSRNSSISLKKEVEILEKYLELEQMRFSNKFVWEFIFKLNNDISKIRIPNMLIQPYIENVIKHGFTENRSGFKVQIIITQLTENILKCEIIDNGIGRNASLLKKERINKNEHISYGEKITKERLKSYNKSKDQNYGTSISDLEQNGISNGTKVEIIIPILKQ